MKACYICGLVARSKGCLARFVCSFLPPLPPFLREDGQNSKYSSISRNCNDLVLLGEGVGELNGGVSFAGCKGERVFLFWLGVRGATMTSRLRNFVNVKFIVVARWFYLWQTDDSFFLF